MMEEVFEQYAGVVDALVLGWWTGAQDEGWSRTLLGPFANVAARSDIPFIVSPVEATGVGAWVAEWRPRGLTFARGVESIYRAVDALDRFGSPVRGRPTTSRPPTGCAGRAGRERRRTDRPVRRRDALLADAGISVAPWLVVDGGEPSTPQPSPRSATAWW